MVVFAVGAVGGGEGGGVVGGDVAGFFFREPEPDFCFSVVNGTDAVDGGGCCG